MSIKYICIWKESPLFNPVRVAQSFLLWIMFCRSLFVLLILLGHCIVCPSSIYGFWLCIWYLQNFSSSEWKGAVVMENQWTALIPNSVLFLLFRVKTNINKNTTIIKCSMYNLCIPNVHENIWRDVNKYSIDKQAIIT
jgi:hypothetical protein